jgi:hypothetical protein
MSKPRKSDRYRVTLTVEGTGCSMYHHGRTKKEAWDRLLERTQPHYLPPSALLMALAAFEAAAAAVCRRVVAASVPIRFFRDRHSTEWSRLHVEVRRLEREA